MKMLGNVSTFVKEIDQDATYHNGLQSIDAWFEVDRLIGKGPSQTQWQNVVSIIPVYSNSRYVTRGGWAQWEPKKIILNATLLRDERLHEDMVETFFHELAHHVAKDLFGDHGHGRAWKWCMRQFGFAPERLHNYTGAMINVRQDKAEQALNKFMEM